MINTLRALLKQKGYSLTKPRLIVFGVLAGKEPQTMAEIIGLTANKIDRATVYRTIELFEQAGIAHRLNIGFKYKIELTEVFNGHHHHLHCTACGRTFPLPANPMLETMIDTVASKADFAPRGHQLEIYGLCQNCSKPS
ncbi:MAG: transcriptional regulator, Fur family transcriptional regulator, ferric uptake regulator [Candidatus Saccharibacteria bacterium]|nr:transcriptional regulator, Fur family transcriptional regulator, ferric uptake regulator [Candidatus Saccharibacteria bacterium]